MLLFSTTLFWLVVAHYVCDYPLQSAFMAAGKNRFSPLPHAPWYQVLFAHATIHGGGVALVTGYLSLGVAEVCVHCFIDYAKTAGRLSYNQDQALHVGCKLAWASLVIGLA